MQLTFTFADIFAGLAFALSCYATWMTVRFNHRQKSLIESQERLNNILLMQAESEKSKANKADLGANFIKLGGGKYRLRIFNKGKSTAHNVQIDFPEGNDVLIQSEIDEKFPLEALEQHQSVDLLVGAHLGSKLKHALRLTWADSASDNNQKTVYVTL
ncbi:MAG: hypothetical protein C0465_25345 [Ralstonia sp.]|uniref:hypothetical protein n=1 Tax=Ralstonia sp. TaxID=54061 RepID=UPI000D2A76E3|nr:hypothetical protein [Ralstonia sp.]MBA4173718.1 hypothetical protein [Hyphomicrobium sp.]MBA4233901.1 hypothetical protein [Ralstonia sp.]PPC80485.1 MAG: hypothetical protein CTY40_09160 [Hyphomicrobium sp.]